MLDFKKQRIPKFNIGDVVRVKSRDYITASLDSGKKLDGCIFVDQMWNYCGNTYPVLRVVDRFFSENKKRTFKPRKNLYILENLLCDGKVDQFAAKCDHSCWLLWHQDWLERIPQHS